MSARVSGPRPVGSRFSCPWAKAAHVGCPSAASIRVACSWDAEPPAAGHFYAVADTMSQGRHACNPARRATGIVLSIGVRSHRTSTAFLVHMAIDASESALLIADLKL